MCTEKIMIVGASNAGLTVAQNLYQSGKDFDITIIDKNKDIGYLGCGTPIFLSQPGRSYQAFFNKDVAEIKQHLTRLYTETTVEKIDFKHKQVLINNSQGQQQLTYDKLVLATGAEQVSLGIAGHELQGIYQIKNLQEGLEVERHLASDDVKDVAIIGGGYIGVEIAEAIRSRGKNVRIFEAKSHMMMSHYDEPFGERVEARLRDVGVQIHLDEEVIAYSGENGAVKQLTTPYDTYETDMVILTMGFLPNTALGREHLDLYTNGAYIVNDKQQTSEPDVYAVGDCATSYSNVLHELVVNFSVSDAMRGAYVAAQNIIGEPISSSGTQRTNAVTVYGLNLFSTGVTVNEAELYGIDYQYVDYEDWQKPTFMPENHRVRLRLVYHAQNRRLIGAQVCSEADQAGVLYLLSLAIQKEVTIDELKVSDFFFYPYFNQPTNFIIEAARLAK